MTYIENPKTKNSVIICAIPNKGPCSNGCSDCFYNGGRSYLSPIDKNTPNMPSLEEVGNKIVRVNDGQDSNNNFELVMKETEKYPKRFYNTAVPKNIKEFGEPVVLTINPGKMTENSIYAIPWYKNLMFVRFRASTTNLSLAKEAVSYYTNKNVPVVITFMAYFQDTPPDKEHYSFHKRILNEYWCITKEGEDAFMSNFKGNELVKVCGSQGNHCKDCHNCETYYYETKKRINLNYDKIHGVGCL